MPLFYELLFVFFTWNVFWNIAGKKKVNCAKLYSYLPVKTVLFLAVFYALVRWDVQFLTVILGVIGTNIVLIIADMLQGVRLFTCLGQISMDIYLLHGPLLVGLRWLYGRLEMPKELLAGCLFFSALVFSVIISKFLLRKRKWVGLLCLGVRIENKE